MSQQPTARPILVTAEAIADARTTIRGGDRHPAAILLDTDRTVLAVGTLAQIASHPAAERARRIDRAGHVLLPGLVNAHTHLDLTSIGPMPHPPGATFADWIDRLRRLRPVDPAEIHNAVLLGAEFCLRGGVVAVGDIAGAVHGEPSLGAAEALAASPLAGTSFVEFFAIGTTEASRLEELARVLRREAPSWPRGHLRLGLQPHAPNTVAPSAYRESRSLARELGVPWVTHAAESPEERLFIAEARGPQRTLLEDLGLWNERLLHAFGSGRSPIEHLDRALEGVLPACVHVHDASDTDIQRLAACDTPVIYCPRAGEYFRAQHAFGMHRYRDMLAAGITVALGTDSIVNLPSTTDRLSTLDEMRALWHRDRTDPSTLLAMATVHGARAIGLEVARVTLAHGARPLGIIALPAEQSAPDPVVSALSGSDDPEWVLALDSAPA
ncbi:MAG: amidohydrolase family protein [Planctomycetota bacterium]